LHWIFCSDSVSITQNGVLVNETQTSRDVVSEVWAALEAHDLDRVDELLDPDVDFWMAGQSFRGAEAFRRLHEDYLVAFPDIRHRRVDHVEDGETIALELRVTGTFTGPLRMGDETVAPTGREVVWESVDYLKVRDGRIASWRVYTDQLAFLRQVGLE